MKIGELFTSTDIALEPCEHCGDPSVDCDGRRMHFATADNGAKTAWEACKTGPQTALFGAIK